MNHDIYVRAHTVELENKPCKSSSQSSEPKWPDYLLCFDCETRLTADQNLTFGFWEFCELRNGEFVCLDEGIFHDQEIGVTEFNLLRKFVRSHKPWTADDGSDRLRLYSRSKFVTEILGMAIQAKALIVGFNLPFDLSRLAVDWEAAKNGGWSLMFSQWSNRETGELQENKFFPRIVVKALNSKTAIIQSMKPGKPKTKKKVKKVTPYPPARFLDVRTLLWALRNKSYSLKTGCKDFNIPGKLDHKPSGKVNLEEIEYCRQDVRATVGLLNAAKQEYDLHPLELKPDKMFSPASIAKSYLEELKISYPSTKVRNADSAYGIAMQSYFGGRAECRIRNWEVPICPVDFMSQYPTVNELLDNSSVLTAKNLTFEDATNEIKQLLSTVMLENCFVRKLWPKLKFFALIRPNNDILPVRTVYNGTTQNIGINYFTSKEPLWFAGPDIIASILLTGKVPHIEKAIRVVPHGKQAELGTVSLRGMVEINAKTDSVFKHVIEQRAANEANPELHYWLKILANSGSYGLFVELNPNESTSTMLKIFSGEE